MLSKRVPVQICYRSSRLLCFVPNAQTNSLDRRLTDGSSPAPPPPPQPPFATAWTARVPLKPWQKAAVALGSAMGALANPARADLVAALGETTGSLAFDHMLSRMKRSSEGRRILADRPRVTSASVGHAWDMPENTFGSAYAKFMGTRNFSPDDRPPVRFMDSEELAYVATRAREIHDFWHVLFNLPTNVIGESALKMVEFQQTYLPMCFLSVVGGTIRLKPDKKMVLMRDYLPWALKAWKSATDLMCIYYEEHFHEDLEHVRTMWGILPAPFLQGTKPKHHNSVN